MIEFPLKIDRVDHEINLWVHAETYRYYVRQRRRFCTHTQLLNLSLPVPYCDGCIQSRPEWMGGFPDIGGTRDAWEVGVMLCVGLGALKRTKAARKKDRHFCWRCGDCRGELRPWRGDDVYVVDFRLEDHYSLPLAKPGQKNPSKRIRDQIIRLYDFRCFACDRKKNDLHIDHIHPRAKGGDASFRNLQPLCTPCGQRKGDVEAEEIDICDDMHFRAGRSEASEQLFW